MFRIQIIIRIAHTAFIMTWPLYTVFKNVQGGIYSTISIVRECRRRSTELTDAKIGPTAREVMLSLEKPALVTSYASHLFISKLSYYFTRVTVFTI